MHFYMLCFSFDVKKRLPDTFLLILNYVDVVCFRVHVSHLTALPYIYHFSLGMCTHWYIFYIEGAAILSMFLYSSEV